MNFGPTELIIILAIIVILFGVGRIGRIAGELGGGIRSFREGLQGEDGEEKDPEAEPAAAPEESTDEIPPAS